MKHIKLIVLSLALGSSAFAAEAPTPPKPFNSLPPIKPGTNNVMPINELPEPAFAAEAPTPPKPFINSLPPIKPGTNNVMSINELPEPAQDFVRSGKRPGAGPNEGSVRAFAQQPWLESRGNEERVGELDFMKSMIVGYDQIKAKIRVKLADLTGSPFARYQLLGYVIDGNINNVNGPFYRVARMFRDAQGHLLMLTEWDYKGAGGGILSFKEYQNQQVRQYPATLALMTGNSSKVLWSLDWVSGNKWYDLQVAGDIRSPAQKAEAAKAIVALASTIPS
ncbi:hypothetical protein [Chitinivorax sp. B]|uniref:hypothetical protein n=1 Tax=Chitinivorax sp. B TaxID=2502235 RepID=UPI0010F62254|nr:hypothetical protein [Chitinivorax sp. B]